MLHSAAHKGLPIIIIVTNTTTTTIIVSSSSPPPNTAECTGPSSVRDAPVRARNHKKQKQSEIE